jgi:hypothetical protein
MRACIDTGRFGLFLIPGLADRRGGVALAKAAYVPRIVQNIVLYG